MIEAEALKLIQDTAVKAKAGKFFVVPNDVPGRVHLIDADGSTAVYDAPQLAKHDAHDFAAVAAHAVAWQGRVWYSPAGVVAVANDEAFPDACKLSLSPSLPFAQLQQWAKAGRGEVGHVEFVLMLRTVFAGCLDAHPSLADDVKRVDFKRVQDASSEVRKAGVSMSKSLMAEASGAKNIPDVLHFTVPAFEQAVATIRVPVRAAFDIDAQSERFRIVVLPGEISRAEDDACGFLRSVIGAALKAAGGDAVPVYRGVP